MKVQEALQSPRPGKSHEEVMKEALLFIEKLKHYED